MNLFSLNFPLVCLPFPLKLHFLFWKYLECKKRQLDDDFANVEKGCDFRNMRWDNECMCVTCVRDAVLTKSTKRLNGHYVEYYRGPAALYIHTQYFVHVFGTQCGMDADPNAQQQKRERMKTISTHTIQPNVLNSHIQWAGVDVGSHLIFSLALPRTYTRTQRKHAISDHLLEWARARARAPTKKQQQPHQMKLNSNTLTLKPIVCCAKLCCAMQTSIHMYASETILTKPNRTNQLSKKDGKKMNGEVRKNERTRREMKQL